MARKNTVTLADVARATGVSLATASKALNAREGISPATRARVRVAARELGYAPSVARGGPPGRPTVGVLFESLGGSLYSLRLLEGITAASAELGVEIVLAALSVPGHWRSTVTSEWVHSNVSRTWDALIVVTSQLTRAAAEACAALGVAVIEIDPIHQLDIRMPSIGSTNWAGAAQATDYLISLGHTDIAFIDLVELPVFAQRRGGHRHAMEAASLPLRITEPLERIVDLPQVVRGLLSGPDRPTAVFAPVDSAAIGVIRAAAERGLRVPQDLSVVGFDDAYAGAWHSPTLTTVRQPLLQMGRTAIVLALEAAAGAELPAHTQLPTELVVRESTAPRG